MKIETLTLEDKLYPEKLKQIQDPPAILYVLGERPRQDEPCVSIVGSRDASKYALSGSTKIAKKISELGVTVISGMAKGTDKAAHEGALIAEKRTIAVVGQSLLFPLSNENYLFMDSILEKNGCIISEIQPWESYGVGFRGSNLVKRNRIISALCDALIVSECGEKSGTRHTIKFADKQGKPIFILEPKKGYSKKYSNMMKLGREYQFLNKEKGKDFINFVLYKIS